MRSMRCSADLTLIEASIWQLYRINAQSVFIGAIVMKHFDSMGSGVDKVIDSQQSRITVTHPGDLEYGTN